MNAKREHTSNPTRNGSAVWTAAAVSAACSACRVWIRAAVGKVAHLLAARADRLSERVREGAARAAIADRSGRARFELEPLLAHLGIGEQRKQLQLGRRVLELAAARRVEAARAVQAASR